MLDESESGGVASSATMNVQSMRGYVDHPFVRALGVSSGDRIYVGVNDFNQSNGQTATIDVSVDGGATYKSVRIETRKTAGQDGPSVRPAVANDGTVYAAFFGWRRFDGKTATSDIVVVRDDAAATGPNPFQMLKDPSDQSPGVLVVKRVPIPWSNAPALGQERIGSTLSIAVDPNNSSTVYVGWADKGSKKDIYTLHVRRSTDRGATWSKTDLPRTTIHNATNVALAVANNGVVGFLYQQLSGGRWVTHLTQSHDAFTTSQDVVLATVPANEPAGQFLPYLGDYDYLLSVGNEFRGVFCANNTPAFANFPHGVTFQRAADFNAKTLNHASGNDVPMSAQTIVVRVDSILKKPPAVSLKKGDSVTVEVKGASAFQEGAHATFYTDGWIFGAGVAVKELGHRIILSDVASAAAPSASEPSGSHVQDQISDQELRERMNASDFVVVGRVTDVHPWN